MRPECARNLQTGSDLKIHIPKTAVDNIGLTPESTFEIWLEKNEEKLVLDLKNEDEEPEGDGE